MQKLKNNYHQKIRIELKAFCWSVIETLKITEEGPSEIYLLH